MLKFVVILVMVYEIYCKKETGPVDKDANFLQLHRDNYEMVVKRKDKHEIMLYHSTESWCGKILVL